MKKVFKYKRAENFCRAFSPGSTDCPWVSEDVQPCDYKDFQKSALRYQLWPSFSRLIFNENASFLEFEFRLRVHFK